RVRAADQLISGTRLNLRASIQRETLAFRSRGPFTLPTPGSGDDPRNGATLEIFNPNTSESFTFDLPGAHWSLNASGTAYRYLDSILVEPGKIRVAVLGRVLRVSGRKTGITLDEAAQGALAVVLTTGTIRYCALFDDGSIRRDEQGPSSARAAPPPSPGPPPPPTTTTLVLPTTTTLVLPTTTTLVLPTTTTLVLPTTTTLVLPTTTTLVLPTTTTL